MTRNTRNNSNGRFPGAFGPEEDDDLPKSKSQRKRDMTALQDLGVELEALPKDRLTRVPMPEALADAIDVAWLVAIFNRLAEGLGWDVPPDDSGFWAASAQRLHDKGYR